MANYSSVIEHLSMELTSSRYRGVDNGKSIHIVYDKDLDSEAFINVLKEYTKTLELINDDEELRIADIDVKSMSVSEFVEQKNNMKLLNVRTNLGFKLCKSFAIPDAKDAGILIVSDFGDFCNFNDSFEECQQEKFVDSVNDFWHIIFLTSDANMKNMPDCCRRLNNYYFIKIEGDSWSMPLFENN